MSQPQAQVWFLTTTLNFPHDRDEWTKQEPFTGDPKRWVYRNCAKLSHKQQEELIRMKKVGWKDHNGVWITVQILPHKVPTKWGTAMPV